MRRDSDVVTFIWNSFQNQNDPKMFRFFLYLFPIPDGYVTVRYKTRRGDNNIYLFLLIFS